MASMDDLWECVDPNVYDDIRRRYMDAIEKHMVCDIDDAEFLAIIHDTHKYVSDLVNGHIAM